MATKTTTTAEQIDIKLVSTNVWIRWGCTICGGTTEKVCILAEAETDQGTIRVCERCLEAGNLNETLEERANYLEHEAHFLRELIGRLSVPSFDEWQAADLHAQRFYAGDCDYEEWNELDPETKRSWIEKAKAKNADKQEGE